MKLEQIPPGKFGFPIFRENLEFIKDPDRYTERKSSIYGDIYKTHILGKPTIIVKGRKWVNYVLENEHKYFENNFPPSLQKLLGNSLSTQHGDVHINRRQLLSKAFQIKNLKAYQYRLQKITNDSLEAWSTQEKIDLYSCLKQYCFDIACEFLIGVSDLSKTPLFNDYNQWSQGMFSIPLNIPFSKFGKAFQARERICLFLDKLMEEDSKSDSNILSILSRQNISDDEVKDQILMLLYAGHGTLASAIWTLCYQLALNINIQEQFRMLSHNTLEESEQFDTFTDSVVKECLRISPPIGGGFRKIIKTNTYEGYTLPENWNVIYQIKETELDSLSYESPHEFDPTRFLGNDSRKILAFGGGARECIGRELAKQELSVFAKSLIRSYRWKFIDIKNIKLSTIPTVHPKNTSYVKIQKL